MTPIKQFLLFASILMYSATLVSCGYSIPSEKVKVDTVGINKQEVSITARDTSDLEVCKKEKVNWKPGGTESILLDPQTDVIFPGSVLDAPSFQNGKFTQITGKRKPVTLSISIPSFDTTSATIENPSLSNVQNGINSILRSKFQGAPPAQLTINSYEIYSRDYLSLLLRAKYSGGFGSVEAGFNFNDETIKSRYLLDVTQIYYSINIDAPGQKGFFSEEPENIGNFSPVYVSSVKYGRRIMIAVETNKNIQNKAFDLKSEFNVFAGSGSLGTNVLSQRLFDAKSIKLLIMGGNPNNAFKIFRAVSTKDTLYDILKSDAVWSLSNQGVPLAYTVRHASDGSIFTVSQAGEYVARKCEVKPTNEIALPSAELSNLCPRWFAGDREFNGHGPNTKFGVSLSQNGNKIFANFDCEWTEDGGDGTAGDFKNSIQIAEVPDSLILLEILSPTAVTPRWEYKDENGHEREGRSFDVNASPVQSVSIMGDTGDDDDLSFNCGRFMNTGILNVKFYPIRVSVRKRR